MGHERGLLVCYTCPGERIERLGVCEISRKVEIGIDRAPLVSILGRVLVQAMDGTAKKRIVISSKNRSKLIVRVLGRVQAMPKENLDLAWRKKDRN